MKQEESLQEMAAAVASRLVALNKAVSPELEDLVGTLKLVVGELASDGVNVVEFTQLLLQQVKTRDDAVVDAVLEVSVLLVDDGRRSSGLRDGPG